MESGLPELLIDRSLGRAAVPKWFAENWPSPVRTIDDVWGQLKVEDTEWMARCQAEGWIAPSARTGGYDGDGGNGGSCLPERCASTCSPTGNYDGIRWWNALVRIYRPC